MKDEELRKLMIKNAKEAVFYKCLLVGLMMQARCLGDYYEISSECFEKVQRAYDKAGT